MGDDERVFLGSAADPPGRRVLLRASLRLFARDGLHGTSVRAIGAEAGLTNPALFKHFAGKDELALQLFERCYRWLAGALGAALGNGPPFRKRLRALVEAFAALVDEEPEAVLYVQENLRRFWPRLSPSLKRLSVVALVRRLVDEGVQEGKVTREAEPALLVTAVIGVLAQFARERYFGEHGPSAAQAAGALDALLQRMVRG